MSFKKRALLLALAAIVAFIVHDFIGDYLFKFGIVRLSSGLGYHLGYVVNMLSSIVIVCIASIPAYALLKWRKVQFSEHIALFMGVSVSLLNLLAFTTLFFAGLSLGFEWRLPLIFLSFVSSIFIGDWIFNVYDVALKRKLQIALGFIFMIFAIPNILYLIF